MMNLEGREYVFMAPSNQKPVRIYGGVRNCFDFVESAVKKIAKRQTPAGSDIVSLSTELPGLLLYSPAMLYLFVVDPVISLGADTVTAPYVLHKNRLDGSAAGATP